VQIKGIAHITGGGFDNLNRILPEGLSVEWKDNMLRPFVFDIFEKDGNISKEEMKSVFNNGIGMCIVVDSKETGKVFSQKISRPAFIAGNIA
jgi:phosphoribosylformylglycinamidine cyclo-ligase